MEVVAAIDVNKESVGRDIGDVVGLGRQLGVKVADDIGSVLKSVKADIVTDATATYLEKIIPHCNVFMDAGLNVASIAEELAYPWIRFPKMAKELDECAKKNTVTIVGSGVNPGFSNDLIPITLASGCWRVDKVKIQRVVDFSPYSPTRGTKRFGVSAAEFREGVKKKAIPLHTGLYESMTMITDSLGWKLDSISESWEVILSRSVRETQWFTIQPGTTCGFKQTAIGVIDEEAKVILEIYCLIHPNPEEDGVSLGDTIWIDGEPNLSMVVQGPTERGDLVTPARLVNILPAVVAARPGLLAVKDLPATPPLPDKEMV
jgi:4-hydroxy-tetrahydrodipicolinate reductase